MKRASDPNTWRYGGFITEVEWGGDETTHLLTWSGEVVEVHAGDMVVFFWTPAPESHVVGVRHVGSCVAEEAVAA